jgi:hypothetical protein
MACSPALNCQHLVLSSLVKSSNTEVMQVHDHTASFHQYLGRVVCCRNPMPRSSGCLRSWQRAMPRRQNSNKCRMPSRSRPAARQTLKGGPLQPLQRQTACGRLYQSGRRRSVPSRHVCWAQKRLCRQRRWASHGIVQAAFLVAVDQMAA